MSDDNGMSRGLILGFLTWTIVGSMLGLLYAPKSGKELRGELREKSDDFLGEAEDYIEQARGKANSLINDGKKKSEKLISETKVKVDALLKEAEEILHDAKGKASVAVESGKEKFSKESDKIKSAFKAGVDTYKSEKEA